MSFEGSSAEYYRDQARRIRELAEVTSLPDMKEQLGMIADQFDRLARQHERRFRDRLKRERNPETRSILETMLAELEARLPADGDRIRQWRMKAAELRAVADQLTHPSTRDAFRRTAMTYDRLASGAEARLTGGQSVPAQDAG